MAQKTKELSQVKARQTKLGKKSNEELIQIVLKKDKVERSLNNQIKSLKGEVNVLSTRVKNFDSDMEGTYQALESYKDRIKVYQEQNDSYITETREYKEKIITLNNKVRMWKIAAGIMAIITVIAVVVVVL